MQNFGKGLFSFLFFLVVMSGRRKFRVNPAWVCPILISLAQHLSSLGIHHFGSSGSLLSHPLHVPELFSLLLPSPDVLFWYFFKSVP